MIETESNFNDPIDAAIASLGQPLSVHHVAGKVVQTKIAMGMGLIVLGIACNALWYAIQGNIAHGFGHILFTPIVFGIGLIGQVIWNRGVRIYTYPVGVLRVSRDKVETFLWDEIASIKVRTDTMKVFGERNEQGEWNTLWIEGVIPTVKLWTMWIEITRQDGTSLKLTPLLEDFAGLSQRIQVETFRRMWPVARNQLAQGEPVSFGMVTARSDGMLIGKKTIAWSAIQTIAIKGNFVSVGANSYWKSKLTFVGWMVSNPHVLFALIDERAANRFPIQLPPPVISDKSEAVEEST